MSEHPVDGGYIGVAHAARLAGLNPRRMRLRLKALHRRHGGGVLFRFAEGRNAKLWTTPQALRKVMPERFDEVSELDLIDLRSRTLALESRVTRAEKRIQRLEQK